MVEIKKGIVPKKFFPDAKHIINYAFSIGAKHYFRFDDHLNIPYQRALSSLVYYKEVEMNIDHKFLEAHVQAVDNILMSAKIDIYKIKSLNDQLKERTRLPKDPELMYKLASVVFFDQEESPEVYEWEYGKKKIAFWKKSTTLKDFFLSMPLVELIPYLKYAGENLETFSQIASDQGKTHSASILALLSDAQKMTLNVKSDTSQAVTPQN